MTLPRLVRAHEVEEVTGLSIRTVYRLIATEHFPRQLRLSRRAVGWREDELRRWIEGRRRTPREFGS